MLSHLNRFRIGVRLAALGTLLLLATAAVGLGGWAGLSNLYRFQGQATRTATAYARAADAARVAQVDFKKQVQEWKDLLLRGGDPAAYAKYHDAFLAKSAQVDRDLQALRTQLQALASNVKGVDQALATHATLQRDYVAALSHYDGADLKSAHVVDGLVKGMDRAPTSAIDDIVAQVQHDQAQAAQRIDQQSLASFHFACWMLLAITLAATLCGALITMVLTRSITLPIRRAVRVAEAVAAGDLSSAIQSDGKDETAWGIDAGPGRRNQPRRAVFTSAENVAQPGGTVVTAQLLDALGRMNGQLREVVAQIRGGAQEIGTSTAQIAAGNADLSARTSEQAAALEETVSSMQEFTRNVDSNADGAQGAQQRAQSSLQTARETREAMGEVIAAMQEIRGASQRIGEITEVLDRLAAQSHILALNATVEAARAGEAGKGFNIVATEVRALAAQSRTSAREIRALVDQSDATVETGAHRITHAGTLIEQLAGSVEDVTRVIGTIAQVSNDQAVDIGQVNRAIHQIDQVTQSNSALVEEAAAAAEAVKNRAQALVQSVAFFRLEDSGQPLPAAA